MMLPLLLALSAQTIFQDSAGDFIVARNQLERSRSQPHFISKFRAGGRELAWTILPPGGRGAITQGPNETFFYVNGNYVLQYRSDGFLGAQHKLSFGCETNVRAAQVNSKGQLWITGEAMCPISAVGEVFTCR